MCEDAPCCGCCGDEGTSDWDLIDWEEFDWPDDEEDEDV